MEMGPTYFLFSGRLFHAVAGKFLSNAPQRGEPPPASAGPAREGRHDEDPAGTAPEGGELTDEVAPTLRDPVCSFRDEAPRSAEP